MFHVVSKTNTVHGKRELLTSLEGREAAREFARNNGGTVKTEAELAQMTADGTLSTSNFALPATIEQEPTMTHETSPAADKTDKVHTNVTAPEDHPAAAATETILGAAETVAGAQAKRTTIGKKEKEEPKRVKTPDETLAAARQYATELAKQVRSAQVSKVGFPRQLALWNDRALTRSDVIALVDEQKLGISPATVSSQFQFARSAKWQEHQQRAKERELTAAQREANKANDSDAKEKAKVEREAAQKANREAKEKAKAENKAAREAAQKASLEVKEKAKVEAKAKAEADARARAEAKAKLDQERAAAKAKLDQERADAKAKTDAERSAAKQTA